MVERLTQVRAAQLEVASSVSHELRSWFAVHADTPRAVALLSPT